MPWPPSVRHHNVQSTSLLHHGIGWSTFEGCSLYRRMFTQSWPIRGKNCPVVNTVVSFGFGFLKWALHFVPGLPQTHSSPLASASVVVGLQLWAAIACLEDTLSWHGRICCLKVACIPHLFVGADNHCTSLVVSLGHACSVIKAQRVAEKLCSAACLRLVEASLHRFSWAAPDFFFFLPFPFHC